MSSFDILLRQASQNQHFGNCRHRATKYSRQSKQHWRKIALNFLSLLNWRPFVSMTSNRKNSRLVPFGRLPECNYKRKNNFLLKRILPMSPNLPLWRILSSRCCNKCYCRKNRCTYNDNPDQADLSCRLGKNWYSRTSWKSKNCNLRFHKMNKMMNSCFDNRNNFPSRNRRFGNIFLFRYNLNTKTNMKAGCLPTRKIVDN